MTEPTSQRIGRMLTLVPWLATRPGVTLTETAAHFGITRETLEADLWQVILCGVPGYGPDQLVDIDFWDGGAIHVHDAQTLTAPLRLSPEESTAIVLGLHALAQTPALEGREAVVSAAAKIQAALDLWDESVIVPTASPPAEIVDAIQRAIEDGRPLTLEYGSADGSVTVRDVWPRHVLTIDGYTYVTGWCARAESVRTFRVDRILRAECASEGGHAPEGDNDPWWETLGTHRAHVRIDASRSWILDEAHDVEVTDDSGSWLEASIGFVSIAWVTTWVHRYPGSVVVEDPPWVVDAVISRAEHLLQAPVLHRG
jgi:proteasome accessory factor C